MKNLLSPFGHIRLRTAISGYIRFWRDWNTYSRMAKAEKLRSADAYPQLYDRTETTPFDSHYFYQPAWLARKLSQQNPSLHVDVGSQINMLNVLCAFMPIVFVDIRPLVTNLPNFYSLSGSVIELPFADNSVQSLSCLHVIEHIGLGRYGDPLDPLGSQKALKELSRVLSVGGHLYISTPIGHSRVQFNAHRIHTPQQIIEYCSNLKLLSFSVVDDQQKFIQNVDHSSYSQANYSCGMFHFTKT